MMMNVFAEFTYNDYLITFGNFKYNANHYTNTLIDIVVEVKDFKGLSTFECDFERFKDFIIELEDIYNFKREKATFVDDYGSMIIFTIDKLGHVECGCELYSTNRRNQLKVNFDADQTALLKFLKQLKGFIKLI